jgi:hypothetical protein
MREQAWQDLITSAALKALMTGDRTQLNALASRLAADERLAIALQAHGHNLNGQPIDVVVCRVLNVKALDE